MGVQMLADEGREGVEQQSLYRWRLEGGGGGGSLFGKAGRMGGAYAVPCCSALRCAMGCGSVFCCAGLDSAPNLT